MFGPEALSAGSGHPGFGVSDIQFTCAAIYNQPGVLGMLRHVVERVRYVSELSNIMPKLYRAEAIRPV